MSLLAISMEIRGKVQGVWYRASAKEEACRLFLNGFVKNQTDDSVYIEVCGSSENLGIFLSWCLKGPELAEVTELIIHKIDIFQSAQFEIIR